MPVTRPAEQHVARILSGDEQYRTRPASPVDLLAKPPRAVAAAPVAARRETPAFLGITPILRYSRAGAIRVPVGVTEAGPALLLGRRAHACPPRPLAVALLLAISKFFQVLFGGTCS
jgi:hypothetical protein